MRRMPVSETGYWETVAITVVRAAIVLLALAAFLSLKGADETVLKARLYLNRKRLLSGLLFLGAGMGVFFLQSLIEVLYILRQGERLPIEVSGMFFLGALVLLAKGFLDLYGLVRAPKPSLVEEGGRP